MLSQTEENYLKTLYLLANEEDVVNLSEISKRLEISSPTANSMIRTCMKKAWLNTKNINPFF